MSKDIYINNLTVKISPGKVIILDKLDNVDDVEALAVVKYLYSEGFIKNLEVRCEIVRRTE